MCKLCVSPCKECSAATKCTTCIDEYEIGNGDKCYEKVEIEEIYPFPFTVFAIVTCVSVMISYCFARMTRIIESAIAIVAFIEIMGWIAVVYVFGTSDKQTSFSLALLALMIHIVINCVYILIYLKCMLPRGEKHFLIYYKYNRACSTLTLIFSGLLSFKFHLLSFSACGNGDHLKA